MIPSEADLKTIIEGVMKGLALWDAKGRLGTHNTAFARALGISPDDLVEGLPLPEVLAVAVTAGRIGHHGAKLIQLELEAAVALRDAVTWDCETEDGHILRVAVRPTTNGGWFSTWEDVSVQIREKAKASHLGQFDALTNLPNRILFREHLANVLARGGNPIVMFVDLDRFKIINDTLGHAAGDALLRAVARRLTGCISDGITARLDGNEFAAALTRHKSVAEAFDVAQRIVAAFAEPFPLGEGKVNISASIGVALAPNDGRETEPLLRAADTALCAAKMDGRGRFRFYEPAMGEAISRTRALEAELGNALACGNITLHYQPIISIRKRRVSAVEALMRWSSPTFGWISPNEFIPISERTGLVLPLGAWALHRACCDATAMPENVRVAVNLSAAQLMASDVVADVNRALNVSGINPQRLELEVTESMMVRDAAKARGILAGLRGIGVRVAMDDFGTGYSSLAQLQNFPFDKIKIDRSFIVDIANGSSKAASIVRAIVQLAAAVGAETVAEGVETREQLTALASAGCDHAQGWLFGKPAPIGSIVAAISRFKNPERIKAASRSSEVALT